MGRKNKNSRSRNAGMKGRAKRFAGEFLPNEILRDLREDLTPVPKNTADDGWDDDLNIEVIEVRPRADQCRENVMQNTGNTVPGNVPKDVAGAPPTEAAEEPKSGNGSFRDKVRLLKKCLVEKPMLFVIGFVFLVIIIWLLVAPEIPGITDRARHNETQTETTKTTETMMETVAVSKADQKKDSKNTEKEKTEFGTSGRKETIPQKTVSEKPKPDTKPAKEKAAEQTAAAEKEPSPKPDATKQNPVPETENWKEKIFGSDTGLVQDKQVFITGLSASEKEKLNFRESDFVKAVSAFLSSKRIDAKTIEFLRKMDISADGAQEYLAVLPGHEDFYLVVLMYPEYPGKYILSFLDLDGLAGSLKEKQESTPETTAVNTPVQTGQTQSVVMSPPAQTPVQTQPQNTAQTETKYDATNLTIMTVPSTLSNYLDNKYELQYTLYDWLYRNGKQNVSTAAVDGYDIDPDGRVAEIIFELDDGSTVYGSYDRDSNSYEYMF